MASLVLRAPCPPSATCLLSRGYLTHPSNVSLRTFAPNTVKCERMEPVNGKPCVPVLNDDILPKFLQSKRLEKAINRNSGNTRLKIFSGTANSALSQVTCSVYGDQVGLFPFLPHQFRSLHFTVFDQTCGL